MCVCVCIPFICVPLYVLYTIEYTIYIIYITKLSRSQKESYLATNSYHPQIAVMQENRTETHYLNYNTPQFHSPCMFDTITPCK